MTTQQMQSATRAAVGTSPPRALVCAIAAVAVLAVAGLAPAIGGLTRGGGSDVQGPYGIGVDVPTSFGAIAIDGVGPRLSPDGRRGQMQAFVAVTNLSGHPIRYSPAQFRLLAGDERRPTGGLQATFRPGRLLADANFSGQLRYRAPRDGSRRWIEFRATPAATPILIDLRRTGARTPDSAFDKFVDR